MKSSLDRQTQFEFVQNIMQTASIVFNLLVCSSDSSPQQAGNGWEQGGGWEVTHPSMPLTARLLAALICREKTLVGTYVCYDSFEWIT